MTTQLMTTTPGAAGRAAYIAGKPRTSNPHSDTSPEFQAYDDAWLWAQQCDNGEDYFAVPQSNHAEADNLLLRLSEIVHSSINAENVNRLATLGYTPAAARALALQLLEAVNANWDFALVHTRTGITLDLTYLQRS